MFSFRYLNNALSSIHERALRLITVITSSLLIEYYRITSKKAYVKKYWVISYWNLQIPSRFNTTDHEWSICHQGKHLEQKLWNRKFGTDTISYRGPQLWNLIPERLSILATLTNLQKEIKKWMCDACPCKMCKTYIQRVDFIN